MTLPNAGICGICEDYQNSDAIRIYQACNRLDGGPCIPCQKHIDLDAEIRASKEALDKLLARRRDIQTEMNLHHDPVVQRLPLELTEKIFESVVQCDHDNWVWKRTSSPFLLGAVCRHWRCTVWSTSKLWSHICISISRPEQMLRTSIQILWDWINRSKDRALSLDIKILHSASLSTEVFDAGVNLPFIKMINNCSHRWEDLRIDCSPELLFHFCGSSQGAPRLRKLYISLDDWEFDNVYTIAPSKSGHKPRPSHVELAGIRFKHVGIDWSNVTDVNLDEAFIDLDECVFLLRHAPRLQYFSAQEVNDPEEIDWQGKTFPQQLIIHHMLKQFKLRGYYGNSLELFFSSFSLPALTHLKLSDIDDNSLPEYIIAFVTRPPIPRISCLEIFTADIYNDYTALLKMLKTIPSLTELSLRLFYDDGINFLLFLASTSSVNTSDNTDSSFLPNLQTIDLGDTFSESVDDFRFLDKLSRILEVDERGTHVGRRPLKNVSLQIGVYQHDDEYLDSEVREQLITLSQRGVTFYYLR